MPGSTSTFGWPFADSADDPDIGIVEDLAEAIEDTFTPSGLTSGKGLVWNGTGWDAADLATQAELDAHSADTTSVHGIADTGALETTTGSAAKVTAHDSDTTGVHGIADTGVLATDAEVASAVSTHTADTTAVHGIADTSALFLSSNVRTKRVTTGSIAAGVAVNVTVTWSSAFADTSYTPVVTVVQTSDTGLWVVHIVSVSTTGIVVRVKNDSTTTTGTLQAIAIHD